MNVQERLKRIDARKRWMDDYRPLSVEEIHSLDSYFKIGNTYSSNALEGNTLTLSETKVVLEDRITIGGKPLTELYEVVGHGKAYDFMISIARDPELVITEDTILRLHQLFYEGVNSCEAGTYRMNQVFISGTSYVPPQAKDVPALMSTFINEINEKWHTEHPILLAAYVHRKLVDIHPFVDGNGRTARLLMNLILLNKGYQIVSIPPILRLDYINSLIQAQTEKPPNDEAFINLIIDCEEEAQRDFCRLFHIEVQFNEK